MHMQALQLAKPHDPASGACSCNGAHHALQLGPDPKVLLVMLAAGHTLQSCQCCLQVPMAHSICKMFACDAGPSGTAAEADMSWQT